jgi:hypothetical protein
LRSQYLEPRVANSVYPRVSDPSRRQPRRLSSLDRGLVQRLAGRQPSGPLSPCGGARRPERATWCQSQPPERQSLRCLSRPSRFGLTGGPARYCERNTHGSARYAGGRPRSRPESHSRYFQLLSRVTLSMMSATSFGWPWTSQIVPSVIRILALSAPGVFSTARIAERRIQISPPVTLVRPTNVSSCVLITSTFSFLFPPQALAVHELHFSAFRQDGASFSVKITTSSPVTVLMS